MPGASLVRFVALAALIVSVGLALWALDLGRGSLVAGVVAAWLVASVIEWIARGGFEAAPRLPPAAGPVAPVTPAPADEPAARSFRLLGLRVTLRKKRTEEAPAPRPAAVPPPEEKGRLAPQPAGPLDDRRGGGDPRRWNLWELERAARDNGGRPAAELEERSLLLLHLRRFASADGFLPAEFDGLVRESFPALTGELEQA